MTYTFIWSYTRIFENNILAYSKHSVIKFDNLERERKRKRKERERDRERERGEEGGSSSLINILTDFVTTIIRMYLFY